MFTSSSSALPLLHPYSLCLLSDLPCALIPVHISILISVSFVKDRVCVSVNLWFKATGVRHLGVTESLCSSVYNTANSVIISLCVFTVPLTRSQPCLSIYEQCLGAVSSSSLQPVGAVGANRFHYNCSSDCLSVCLDNSSRTTQTQNITKWQDKQHTAFSSTAQQSMTKQ